MNEQTSLSGRIDTAARQNDRGDSGAIPDVWEPAIAEQICSYADGLRLPFVSKFLRARLRETDFLAMSSVEAIRELLETEYQRRRGALLQTRFKKAGLKCPDACLNDTLLDPARTSDADLIRTLSGCQWIDAHQNLIITGPTGAGKTYLGCALAGSALTQMKTVRYLKASELLTELDRAEKTDTLPRAVDAFSRLDLLIIDDFGLSRLDTDSSRKLFEVIDRRDGAKSTMVISQISVSAWYDLFEHAVFAEAILDRFTHEAYRIQMTGNSLRRRDPVTQPTA